jgi:hypothetical protein
MARELWGDSCYRETVVMGRQLLWETVVMGRELL